jgi:hypothetical protein
MSAASCPEVQQQLELLQQRMARMLQAMGVEPDVPPEPVAVAFDPDHLDALLSRGPG